jgi:hypothetical protein
MKQTIKLDLISVPPQELVDQRTLATYMSEGAEHILAKNRPFYTNSQEICVSGIYFALSTFQEEGVNFRILSLYKRQPRQKQTYFYCFGAYNPKANELLWFFNLDSVCDNRLSAIKVFKALETWCANNEPDLLPFAYKK